MKLDQLSEGIESIQKAGPIGGKYTDEFGFDSQSVSMATRAQIGIDE
jgi:hypothetical protein